MHPKFASGLIAATIVLAPAAALAAHGKPGLWNISSTMEMANMPQMPPEAMAMMKSRGTKMPGTQPITSQICMTQEQVNGDKPPMSNREESCTTKLLNQTSTSMTSEVTCHGKMEGVGHAQMSWRGNEHYEGTYSFKGTMEGRPQQISTRYTGDFVKSDCGSVKPAKVMSH